MALDLNKQRTELPQHLCEYGPLCLEKLALGNFHFSFPPLSASVLLHQSNTSPSSSPPLHCHPQSIHQLLIQFCLLSIDDHLITHNNEQSL